jgi:hypothetical protein
MDVKDCQNPSRVAASLGLLATNDLSLAIKYAELPHKYRSQRCRLRKKIERAAYNDYSRSLQEQEEAMHTALGRRCKRIQQSPLFTVVVEMMIFGASVMDVANFLRGMDPYSFDPNFITDDALRMQIARMRRYAVQAIGK